MILIVIVLVRHMVIIIPMVNLIVMGIVTLVVNLIVVCIEIGIGVISVFSLLSLLLFL